jgi:uncharacterized protein (TIGR02147 family)
VISVFDYLDYRKYLADYYGAKKAINKHFSYRLITDKAGIPSSGYFSEVLSGRRNLTLAKVPKFAKAFGLDASEEAFLGLLVAFNHARTETDKQRVYERMVEALPVRAQRLRRSQQEYFTKWYYAALRESLAVLDVRDDYEVLATFLRPSISVPQAKAGIRLLESMDLVARDSQGCWRATQKSLISQRDESTVLLVRGFQSEMIGLARQALLDVPPEEREVSCMTMSVSAKGLELVKARIKDCQERIREIVHADRGEDRVIQLNLQIFPLTRKKARADD